LFEPEPEPETETDIAAPRSRRFCRRIPSQRDEASRYDIGLGLALGLGLDPLIS
jgi:hypothetical protein